VKNTKNPIGEGKHHLNRDHTLISKPRAERFRLPELGKQNIFQTPKNTGI
jgi:hypothetical protein